MLLEETDIIERIESPLNLLNRLRKETNKNTSIIPSIPNSNELVDDLDEKIAIGSTKSKAYKIINKAMERLDTVIATVDKPKELAGIAESMGKIISNTQIKVEDNRTQIGQIVIYAPEVAKEEDFETLDIQEIEEN